MQEIVPTKRCPICGHLIEYSGENQKLDYLRHVAQHPEYWADTRDDLPE